MSSISDYMFQRFQDTLYDEYCTEIRGFLASNKKPRTGFKLFLERSLQDRKLFDFLNAEVKNKYISPNQAEDYLQEVIQPNASGREEHGLQKGTSLLKTSFKWLALAAVAWKTLDTLPQTKPEWPKKSLQHTWENPQMDDFTHDMPSTLVPRGTEIISPAADPRPVYESGRLIDIEKQLDYYTGLLKWFEDHPNQKIIPWEQYDIGFEIQQNSNQKCWIEMEVNDLKKAKEKLTKKLQGDTILTTRSKVADDNYDHMKRNPAYPDFKDSRDLYRKGDWRKKN